jgi:hypothetical protein
MESERLNHAIGHEVKPGVTVSCDAAVGSVIHLSQVYTFPYLSVLCLFASL